MRFLQPAVKRNFWSFPGKAAFSSLASDVTYDGVDLRSAPLTTLSEDEEMMRDTGNGIYQTCFNH